MMMMIMMITLAVMMKKGKQYINMEMKSYTECRKYNKNNTVVEKKG